MHHIKDVCKKVAKNHSLPSLPNGKMSGILDDSTE
jgi:hypothetical protein